jgi:DNA polymerase-3 subunit gamma/tau
MAYVALYRQWRPQDFENLIGQEHISTTLKNAIGTGKIAHAYLFSGPRGTGKTSTAKILAKALNCVDGPTATPCNQCSNCERITLGTSMDVFEIDAASNRGIDEIRDLREAVKFAPVDGRYKVYIIDEVHMLTTEAFNALLKTLEEPPAHVVFVLATTEPHKIPATIHSRCQRYDFRRIPVTEIMRRLEDVAQNSGLMVTQDALRLIAVHADGGLRDALSILDQCTALGEERITAEAVRGLLGLVGHEWVWKLTDAMAERDAAKVITTLDELFSLGKDARQILLELAVHARSLMLYKAAPGVTGIEMYSDDPKVLVSQSDKFSHDDLVKMIQGLQVAANESKWAAEPRITAEMALLAVCRRAAGADLTALAERVAALEAALSAGVPKSSSRNVKPKELPTIPAETSRPKQEVILEEPEQPAGIPLATEPQEVWEAVLKDLLTSGKRSVHACVSQGNIGILNESQVTLQFSSAFAKERSEKDDYRAILEKALAQVMGRQVKVNCVLGAAVPQRKEEIISPVEPASKEQHPVLNQAIKMFGGKVTIEEKNEEG